MQYFHDLNIQLGVDPSPTPQTHPLQMALWGMLFGYIVMAVKAAHPSAELAMNLKLAGAVLSVPVVLVGVAHMFYTSLKKIITFLVRY